MSESSAFDSSLEEFDKESGLEKQLSASYVRSLYADDDAYDAENCIDESLKDVAMSPGSYPQRSFSLRGRGKLGSFSHSEKALYRKPDGTEIETPCIGGGKPFPPHPRLSWEYTVEFDGPEDPAFPQNWPQGQKISTFALLIFDTFVVTWASSVYAPSVSSIAERFAVSETIATLGLSLYIVGFAAGPCLWGPLSEVYGRKKPIVLGTFLFAVFQFATATSENIQTLLICRFFGGLFGASPLTITGAAFTDFFSAKIRGAAMCIFLFFVFFGPLLSPIIGGILVQFLPSTGWRWANYITGILGLVATVLLQLFQQESYAPVVLSEKARMLRVLTGNWAVHSPLEEVELEFSELLKRNLRRPFQMLAHEPMLFFISLYNAFLYGLMYLILKAYPIIFVRGYELPLSVGMLPYLGLILGTAFGLAASLLGERRFNKILRENPVPNPEARIPAMIVGSLMLPIGLFVLGWTGSRPADIPLYVPLFFGGVPIGFSMMTIFPISNSYCIDMYLKHAASALAVMTFTRSAFGAAFPLFAQQMYDRLGIAAASSLLAGIAVAMIPVPCIILFYGSKIRARTKMSSA